MEAHRRTEITVETDLILVIRKCRTQPSWCPECGREVDVVSLGEARTLTGVTPQTLHECAEAGRWHVSQGADGGLLVCLESLLKSR